jgi:hypothetical protein
MPVAVGAIKFPVICETALKKKYKLQFLHMTGNLIAPTATGITFLEEIAIEDRNSVLSALIPT